MKLILSSLVAILVALFSLTTDRAIGQTLDNKGKDFIVSFLPNYLNEGMSVELHLTADTPTTVAIEYPVNAPTFSTSVAVTPGTITTVSLPSDAAKPTDNVVNNNSVRMSAESDFTAYMINRIPFTSDAAVALPIDVMNKDYIVMTYNQSNFGFGVKAQFSVVASVDNTTVTITPSNDLLGGQLANVPFNVVLNRGESFFIKQAVDGNNGGLAGTIVSADKPVGMTNGNACTQVPLGTAFCDTVFEVAAPVQTWGKSMPLVNVADRPNGSYYRILASVDNSEIFLDGASQGTINRGQFLELGPLAGNHVVSSSNPIFGAIFITGSGAPGATTGDPSMSNIVPTEQFAPTYTFSTVGAGQFVQHYLTLVVHNIDVGSMTLDGTPVSSELFSAIPGTDFSAAVVSVLEGTHTTNSSRPHGLSVLGYTSNDSYMYPAGAKFSVINPVNGTLDCEGVFNGTKVVDRCGVCGGDGNSCLGCSQADNFAALLGMDGAAHKQLKLTLTNIQELSKVARSAKTRSLVRSLKATANSLYAKNWTVSWGLPVVSTHCTNTTFCSSISTASAVGTYRSNANELLKIGKRAIAEKVKITKRSTKLDAKYLARVNTAYKEAIAGSRRAPSAVSSCS